MQLSTTVMRRLGIEFCEIATLNWPSELCDCGGRFCICNQDLHVSAWSVLDLSIDKVLIPPHRWSSNNALVLHNLAGATSPRYEYLTWFCVPA